MIAGIILQWRLQLPVIWLIVLHIISVIFIIALFALPLFKKFQLGWLTGIAVTVSFAALGAMLAWMQDIRNHEEWLGNHYQPKQVLIVTLQEDPIQKNKSYKALASARWLNDDGTLKKVKGDLTIYFQKDSTIKNYKYGQQLVFQKELQNIQNAGNPGGFDYKRFCLFQDITHQVYLKTNEFILPAYYIKRWKPYLDQQ